MISSHFSPDKSKSSSGSGITKLSGGSGSGGTNIDTNYDDDNYDDDNGDDDDQNHLPGFLPMFFSGGSYIPNWSDLFPPPPTYPPRYDVRGLPNYSIPLPLICPTPSTKQAEVILFPLPATRSPSPTRQGCPGTPPIW